MTSNYKSIKSEIVDGFCCAALNHYSFDQLAYNLFEKNIDDFYGIPRPSKWMKKNGGMQNILKPTAWWVRFFWRHCLAYLFFIKYFLIYFFNKKSFNCDSWIDTKKVLSLAICSRSITVINQALVDDEEKTWLTFPWENVVNLIGHGNSRVIDCISVLSRKQLVHALFSAFAAHGNLKKCDNVNMIMQSYTAFDWAVVYMAIKNLAPNVLTTSEHHDRWAVLVDTYCSNMLKSNGKVGFNLVQHGLEYEQTYIEMANNTKCDGLPYKLKCVTDIYLYSKEQCVIFNKNIISKNYHNKIINVFYFKPKINVYDSEVDRRVKILFIGHTACEDLQVRIYNHVSKIFDFSFFYKPHPTAKMHKELFGLGWQIVEGKLNFPKVDFLISYQSTLIDEYKEIGVDAFVHPMILSDNDFDITMSRLVARLKEVSGVNYSS